MITVNFKRLNFTQIVAKSGGTPWKIRWGCVARFQKPSLRSLAVFKQFEGAGKAGKPR